jgi:hypothetical protein
MCPQADKPERIGPERREELLEIAKRAAADIEANTSNDPERSLVVHLIDLLVRD